MKCYMGNGDSEEGHCPHDARYEAFVDWTAGVALLCEEHALLARADDAVLSIRKITFTRKEEQ